MTYTMTLSSLLQSYIPGSGSEEDGWQSEFDWLWSEHGGHMDMLTTSIQETGMHEPILLGDDGRVWDGHHRIAAAQSLGLHVVPVVHAASLRADHVVLVPAQEDE